MVAHRTEQMKHREEYKKEQVSGMKKRISLIAISVAMIGLVILGAWLNVKDCRWQEERTGRKVIEQDRQQGIPKDTQGSITIYLNDGTVWGYFGEVHIISDGRNGKQPEIELKEAWLVGSTHPDFQLEEGQQE